MPVPVQIYDDGRLIRFRSKKLFFDLLGWSHTYQSTSHYKQKFGDETLQQLWDRTDQAHARLEAFMKTNKSEFDAASGMQSFKKGRVIVYPYGYEDNASPRALKELDEQALRADAPVASPSIMSHPVIDAIVHFFIDKAAEYSSAGYEIAHVHAMYDDITALRLSESQDRIVSVSNDTQHTLVSMLNTYFVRDG